MNDHIVLVQHRDTMKWYGLFYRNCPTPSGSPRPILSLSTTEGFDCQLQALEEIKKAFSDKELIEIDLPSVEANTTKQEPHQ